MKWEKHADRSFNNEPVWKGTDARQKKCTSIPQSQMKNQNEWLKKLQGPQPQGILVKS